MHALDTGAIPGDQDDRGQLGAFNQDSHETGISAPRWTIDTIAKRASTHPALALALRQSDSISRPAHYSVLYLTAHLDSVPPFDPIPIELSPCPSSAVDWQTPLVRVWVISSNSSSKC
jgi:hypothetical protein